MAGVDPMSIFAALSAMGALKGLVAPTGGPGAIPPPGMSQGRVMPIFNQPSAGTPGQDRDDETRRRLERLRQLMALGPGFGWPGPGGFG